MIPVAPLTTSSASISANSTNVLKSTNIIASTLNVMNEESMTVLSGGTLTGLTTSSDTNAVATKEYSDSIPYPIPGGPTDNSIQVNSGSNLFTGYDNLKWVLGNPNTLNINGALSIYPTTNVLIRNNIIENVADPVDQKSAVNKEYVQSISLGVIDILTNSSGSAGVTTTLVASQVVNTILERKFITGSVLNQDILPTAAQIINYIFGTAPVVVGYAFTFIYKYLNYSKANNLVVLYGSSGTTIIPKGDYFYINTEDNNINVYPGTIVEFTATVISSTILNFYINNYQQLVSSSTIRGPRQTKYGLLTNNMFVQKNAIFNNAFVIKPLAPTAIVSSSPATITFNILKGILIIRSATNGLTNSIVDPLDTTANMFASTDAFAQGSGLLRFTVQNIDPNYNISLGTSAGWSFTGSTLIKPGHNGMFGASFNVQSTTAILFTFGFPLRSG